MEQFVSDALEHAFPHRTASAVESPEGSERPGNHTVRVRFDDGERIYLKFVTDGETRRVRRAAAVQQFLRARSPVRVPQVIATEPDRDPPFLATSELPGTPLRARWEEASTEAREEMLYAVGKSVAQLHTVAVERSGHIVGGGPDELSVEEDSWTNTVCGVIDSWTDTFSPDRFSGFPDRVKRMLRDHSELLSDRPVSVLHGDPNLKNYLLAEGSDIGIVDWEDAFVGDPSFGLCRAEAMLVEQPPTQEPARLLQALRAGYRSRAVGFPLDHEELAPVYEVVTFLNPALTFEYWAPDAELPTAELAAWIADEMDRRIDAVDARSRA